MGRKSSSDAVRFMMRRAGYDVVNYIDDLLALTFRALRNALMNFFKV